MCGYVVTTSKDKINFQNLYQMQKSIRHRGDDDSSIVYLNANNEFMSIEDQSCKEEFYTGFAFQRLSIQDLTMNARQPMISSNGRYIIVYNGEIYNFIELKKDLESKGHIFRSNSDTEVVLKLYELFEEKMLNRLNGMFSFIIYDNLRNKFFMARDRLGIKPLYIYYKNDNLIISSEIKSFLFHPKFVPEHNDKELDEYMMFGYVSSDKTLFKNVRQCLPGHYMIFENNDLKSIKYWDTGDSTNKVTSTNDLYNDFSDLIYSSINYQLISDVEVGAQLSGGIDSSLIAGIASNSKKSFKKTFSIILNNHNFSEEKYIDIINNKYLLQPNKTLLENSDIIDNLELATWHHDQPLREPNAVGIFMLAKEAKKYLKVLLSGEGSDEIFGGYDRYNAARIFTETPNISKFINTLRSKDMGRDGDNLDEILISLSSNSKFHQIVKIYPEFNFKKALSNRKKIFMNETGNTKFQKFLNYEQKTYLSNLLIKQDKMCMAHGIENRVPFLDHRIVEFASMIPNSFKTRLNFIPLFLRKNNSTKFFLKEYSKKYFANDFIHRKKLGFNIPISDTINDKQFFDYIIFLIEEAKKVAPFNIDIKSIKDINKYRTNLIWSIISFGAWSKTFLHSKPYEY